MADDLGTAASIKRNGPTTREAPPTLNTELFGGYHWRAQNGELRPATQRAADHLAFQLPISETPLEDRVSAAPPGFDPHAAAGPGNASREVWWNPTTWRKKTWGYVALGAGTVALALTGVGLVAELSTVAAVSVGATSVGLGTVAAAAGKDACANGVGAGCVGEVFGVVSTLASGTGVVADGLLLTRGGTLAASEVASLQTISGASSASGFMTGVPAGLATAADTFGWRTGGAP